MLAINSGGLSIADWPYCGFKGGSSPGRIAFAVVLQSAAGEWLSIALIQNTTPAQLRVEVVAQILKRAADHLGVEVRGPT
jgi:hypothetical protein